MHNENKNITKIINKYKTHLKTIFSYNTYKINNNLLIIYKFINFTFIIIENMVVDLHSFMIFCS